VPNNEFAGADFKQPSGKALYMNDQHYMELALELAARGRGYTSPNPMVGAVVVKNGRIVGKGFHEAAGKPHAEVNAINDAGDDAGGAVIYVTLEPCNHTGRTPPCTEKIIRAGIRRVVTAMEDPNPSVRGGGIARLMSAGIEVTTGVCEDKARKLNEVFVKFVTTGRPFVLLKCAATLDGRIATRTGDSKWVTGPAARAYVHRLRHEYDGILVGIGTVKSDNPSLTARIEGQITRDPIRIILDTRLSIPQSSLVLNLNSDSPTLLVTGSNLSPVQSSQMKKKGVRIIECPTQEFGIDLNALMERLGKLGITSVLIEGGSRAAASALNAGIVDKVAFFYAPKILGGDDGAPMCRGTGPELMNQSIQIRDIRIQRFEDDILVEGYVVK